MLDLARTRGEIEIGSDVAHARFGHAVGDAALDIIALILPERHAGMAIDQRRHPFELVTGKDKRAIGRFNAIAHRG